MKPEPAGKAQRTTWRVHVRDIAPALGISVKPDQWIELESAEDDGTSVPLNGYVDVVVWENVGGK